MPGLAHHFYTMASNNAWANHRLLAACARLSQDDFAATRTSFFPSIKATLNHIVTVDWYYVDALERALRARARQHATPAASSIRKSRSPPVPRFPPRSTPSTSGSSPCARRSPTRKWRCRSPLSRRAGVQHETATRLLAHLFQHQIHHRGQVHAMLAGTAVAPPQLDEFFCANEAHLRARELAEIGLPENAVWT